MVRYTCIILLVGSFLTVKFDGSLWFPVIMVLILPVFILSYKSHNKADRPYFYWFIAINSLLLIIALFIQNRVRLDVILCSAVIEMLIGYGYYIFKYYNKYSAEADEKYYDEKKKPADDPLTTPPAPSPHNNSAPATGTPSPAASPHP
jgi:Ca2+/Na+ antiporter